MMGSGAGSPVGFKPCGLLFKITKTLLKPQTSRLANLTSREVYSGREWTRTIDLTDANPVV